MPKPNVSPNITFDEYACQHCHKLPPGFLDDDLQLSLEYQILFKGFEEIREKRGGKPLGVESGYRCRDHEQALYDAWVEGGKKGAVHGFLSIHLFGLALDLTPIDWVDQAKIVKLARALKPKPRIGWAQYKKSGSLLVHIDYGQFVQPCPTLDFQPGLEW